MTIREQVKAELDKVEDEYLAVVQRMLASLETPSGHERAAERWRDFIASTYGSLADAPIERGDQGQLEVRELAGREAQGGHQRGLRDPAS
ncbi:MAG: hypothetical protein ACOC92_01130 [bacterium]